MKIIGGYCLGFLVKVQGDYHLSQDSNIYLNCTARFISRETCTTIVLVSLNIYQSKKMYFKLWNRARAFLLVLNLFKMLV